MRRDDRPGLWMPNYWSTVGGAVELDESPAQAAVREAEEELGQRPGELTWLGFVEGARHRVHLFATRADWTLDELIVGEGQGVDWLSPEQIFSVPVVDVLLPPLGRFLASQCYRELAAGPPPAKAPLLPPFPAGFAGAFGSQAGDLFVVRGATAGFVRRLWDVLDGVRVSASPADWERPKTVLWWPRGEPMEETLRGFADRLAPAGMVWVASSDEAVLASVFDVASSLGLKPVAGLNLPSLGPIICLMR